MGTLDYNYYNYYNTLTQWSNDLTVRAIFEHFDHHVPILCRIRGTVIMCDAALLNFFSAINTKLNLN